MKNISFRIILINLFIAVTIQPAICASGNNPEVKKGDSKTNFYIISSLNREQSSAIFYNKCAVQARKQGLPEIAKVFEEAAKINNDHYIKLKVLAATMKIQITENKFEYPVMSTIENIKKAYAIEMLESKSYGEALKAADKENIQTAETFYKNGINDRNQNQDSIKKLMEKMK